MSQRQSAITVLHVITSLERGGAERMLTLLVSRRREGFRHIVISLTDEGQFGPQIAAAGASLYCLGLQRRQASMAAFLQLARLIRQNAPDVIQTWLYHADLAGLLGRLLAGSKAPVLWNIRCSMMGQDYHPRLTRLVLRLLALLSPLPAAVLSNSNRAIEEHAAFGYRPRRWISVPNGFDVEQWQPDAAVRRQVRTEWGLTDDAFVFGMVARLDPMKDFANFLRAANIVAAHCPRAHFVLIGKGATPDAPIIASAVPAAGQLQHRLLCLGQQQNVARLLPALDCHVLSSAFGEGFPNVLGEAMACGVPCITTDVGDAATIVGDTGLVVPPQDSDALAGAMNRMLSFPDDRRQALSEAARDRILTKYSLNAVDTQYHEIYRSLAR